MTPTCRSRIAAVTFTTALLVVVAGGCFDAALRWVPVPPPEPAAPVCEVGEIRCTANLEECQNTENGADWIVIDDCADKQQVCAPTLAACANCFPDQFSCDGLDVMRCDSTGENNEVLKTCDPTLGQACREGGCLHLCDLAKEQKSNVGCEYWAVDLDNAMIDATSNAAAQQYAVVVSNPHPDVATTVQVFQDDGQPGDDPAPYEIAEALIAPLNLRVFKLGPREVDGSPEGEFNTGTHSALTRRAYRVTSDFPVVAYQFNPLENVAVFSNDASLLKPREALTYDGDSLARSYVVASWPQTIAITDDPQTNFSSSHPINLRAFLTIVGTAPDTTIVVRPTTAVVQGAGVPFTAKGETLEMTIDAFDVVNLESLSQNAFGADFTGTVIESDQPVAVFTGSEASDAPHFETLLQRRCCADHLEEQLDPLRTAGKKFALAHSPSRTATVLSAGGDLAVAPEPEYFRFVAASDAVTTITTTLPPPNDELKLFALGDFAEITTLRDFMAESDEPLHVVQVMASQAAANVPQVLPGGDPSLLVVPPLEQYRADYVFLTPDKYAFDFITVTAPAEAIVVLDETILTPDLCEIAPADGLSDDEREGPVEFVVYRCQLSFATVDPDTGEVTEGVQNDGVHRVSANIPIGVTVWGFDSYVSYAYAGGTELTEIAVPE